MVPLWWDAGTLADLVKWKAERLRLGATPDALFVASLRPGRGTGLPSRHTLRKRFRTACKVLGRERLETLTIHHGRHTFISHALSVMIGRAPGVTAPPCPRRIIAPSPDVLQVQ